MSSGISKTIEVMKPIPNGFIEKLELEPYGLLRCTGWTLKETIDAHIAVNGNSSHATRIYRRPRSDVAVVHGNAGSFSGFAIEFYPLDLPAEIEITVGPTVIRIPLRETENFAAHQVQYGALLGSAQVFHRDDIYGVGQPTDETHPDILALALKLKSPVLDIGCGAAPYIRALRTNNQEAFGIEIDRSAIRTHLKDDVRQFVTLYDGSLPLPFENGQFESVLCTEVLEHVEQYEALLAEIARVAKSSVVITVPDMTCIPAGSYQGIVPWHLLESSHINFFTASNLEPLLKKYFRSVTLFQLGHSYVNGQFMPGSLGILAIK